MADNVGIGALSYLGYQLEAVKGTPAAAINNFLFVTGNNITATPDIIRKQVMMGDRSAERIIRPSKFKIHGTLTHPLYANSGAEFILAALGLDTYLTSVAGTAAGTATANGLTTFTSTSSITPGAWTTWGAGATQDIRMIVPNPGVVNGWRVAALSPANAAATAFTQPAQHKFSPIPASANNAFTLPSMTLELNEGGQWAWQLAGSMIGKYTVKGGKEDVEISSNVHGTVMPRKLAAGSFTAFSPTNNQLADVARPFDINDGYFMVPWDASASGASGLSPVVTAEDWEFDIDNGMLEKAFWDDGQVYKVYPGVRKGTVKYKYAINAQRPDSYEDYLVLLKATPIPFISSMALNVGTVAVPSWYAYGIYAPSMIMTKADIGRSVTDVLTMSVEADLTTSQVGQDFVDIFVMNSSAAVYVGS